MKKWFILSSVVAVLSLAVVAMAQQGPGQGGGRGPGGPGGPGGFGGGPEQQGAMMLQRLVQHEELAKKLGVTDEQLAAIKTNLYDSEKQMAKLRADVEVAEIEVRRLMQDEGADRDAVLKAIDASGLAHTAMRKAGVEMRLKVRDILGPELAAKVRKEIAERMRERGGQQGGAQQGERRRDRGERGNDDRGGAQDRGERQGKGPAWMQDEMQPPADNSAP